MPWQSLIQVQTFFAPPPGAPEGDSTAEQHAAQQFGNGHRPLQGLTSAVLALATAIQIFTEPIAAILEAPAEDATVVAGSQSVAVGKWYSTIVVPAGSFDPPWDTSSGVVVTTIYNLSTTGVGT